MVTTGVGLLLGRENNTNFEFGTPECWILRGEYLTWIVTKRIYTVINAIACKRCKSDRLDSCHASPAAVQGVAEDHDSPALGGVCTHHLQQIAPHQRRPILATSLENA